MKSGMNRRGFPRAGTAVLGLWNLRPLDPVELSGGHYHLRPMSPRLQPSHTDRDTRVDVAKRLEDPRSQTATSKKLERA